MADASAVVVEELPGARRRRGAGWMLVLPATVVLLALFVVPIGLFAVYSLLEGSQYDVTWHLTLSNYSEAFSSAFARRLAGNAFLIGGVTSALSLAIALPVAYFIRFRAGRLEYPLLFLVLLGFVASYLVRIYAWRTILGEDGILNSALGTVGIGSPGKILYTRGAVVITLVHIFVPYVTLVLYASLRNVPRGLLDLAADLGAGAASTWRRVVLPLLAPAMVSAFLFTLVLSASDFVTPEFLGGTSGNMVGLLIEQEFTQVGNFPSGAAMSLIMLALFGLVYALLAAMLRALNLHRVARTF